MVEHNFKSMDDNQISNEFENIGLDLVTLQKAYETVKSVPVASDIEALTHFSFITEDRLKDAEIKANFDRL